MEQKSVMKEKEENNEGEKRSLIFAKMVFFQEKRSRARNKSAVWSCFYYLGNKNAILSSSD